MPEQYNDPINQVIDHLWQIAIDEAMDDAHRYRTIRCAINYLSQVEQLIRKVGRNA